MTTSNKTDKLRECPFCGEQPEQNAFWEYYCVNLTCPIHHAIFRTVERWNTRAIDTALTHERAHSEGLAEELQRVELGDALVNAIIKDIEEESMDACEFKGSTKVLGLRYIRSALYRHIGSTPERESVEAHEARKG